MSLSTRLISTAASATLLLTGIVGGYAGNVIAEQNAAALTARENVATMIAQNLSAVDYLAGTQATAILADFASVTDVASALVASSDGKASQDARNALQAILDEIKIKTSAHVETGAEARDTAAQIVATGTPAIEAASKVVTDEVAAWEAEKAAAEAAAQAEREAAQRSSGGSSNSNSNSGGSSGGSSNNNNNGGGNSGGGSCIDRYAAEAAAAGWGFRVIDGNTSYWRSGEVLMGSGPANACAAQVFWHEMAHGYTGGTMRAMCAYTSRDLGGDIETWAQAWTQTRYGWSAGAYAPASQSYIDGMRNAGCL